MLFPGCLCRISGSFPVFCVSSSKGQHRRSSSSRRLSFFLLLNFLVSDGDMGFYLKILLYCEGGPSSWQFSTWRLKTLEQICEPWTFTFIFCLWESQGTPSWSVLLRAKKNVLPIVIFTLMLCGPHHLLSKWKSQSRNDMHRKEIT